jgi:hypothetical protein
MDILFSEIRIQNKEQNIVIPNSVLFNCFEIQKLKEKKFEITP